MIRGKARDAGFSLLEVMVAFIILMLSLPVLLQSTAQAVDNEALAYRYQYALSLAQSKLEALGHLRPVGSGVWIGQDAGLYDWRMEITRRDAASSRFGPVPSATVMLYDVQVQVSWPSGNGKRSVQLRTNRAVITPSAGR